MLAIKREIDIGNTDIRGDLLQGLAHGMMEDRKPDDWPSASWRTRKPSGEFSPSVEA